MLNLFIGSKGPKSDEFKQATGTQNYFIYLLSLDNRIDSISAWGTHLEDEEEIRVQASIFFSILLQSSLATPDESPFDMAGPSVSIKKNQYLTAIPSPLEIRKAVFRLKKSSSLGPDRFSWVFYKGCWNIVDQEVISMVTHFFSSGRVLRESNTYFLSLISKKQSPETFSDFCPISLLNFTYKIIFKILATMLFGILPSLVSSQQSAFVKGRSIHHHVALAHDLFQKLKPKISGGIVCLKLDIANAFDRLLWNFLFRALHFFNFSLDWINLIRELICTIRGSVLINKSPLWLLLLLLWDASR